MTDEAGLEPLPAQDAGPRARRLAGIRFMDDVATLRRRLTPAVVNLLRNASHVGYPTSTGANGGGGHGDGNTVVERYGDPKHADQTAHDARQILVDAQRLMADFGRAQTIEHILTLQPRLTSILRRLESWQPDRAAWLECAHCRRRTPRDVETCQCGAPHAHTRCANPNHTDTWHPTADLRNGRCDACRKYLDRHRIERPAELCNQTIRPARRTSDTQLAPCTRCGERYAYPRLRDGICPDCILEATRGTRTLDITQFNYPKDTP